MKIFSVLTAGKTYLRTEEYKFDKDHPNAITVIVSNGDENICIVVNKYELLKAIETPDN